MSLWSREDERVTGTLNGLIPVMPNDFQLRQYVNMLKIEDITTRLKSDNVIPAAILRDDKEYDAEGRLIPRDVMYRQRMERERDILIREVQQQDYAYRPPGDAVVVPEGAMVSGYHSSQAAQSRCSDVIYIPQAGEFPELNFVGMLLGPRGSTLQAIQQQANVKISIRGRGAEKVGNNSSYQAQPGQDLGQDDDMHALVMGESPAAVKRGIDLIYQMIESACSTKDSAMVLKRQQLEELSRLKNGQPAESESDVPRAADACMYCDAVHAQGAECPHAADPVYIARARERQQKAEADYAAFMQSLGGVAPVTVADPTVKEQPQNNGPNPDLELAPWAHAGPATGFVAPQPIQQQVAQQQVEEEEPEEESYMARLMRQQMAGMTGYQ